MNDYPFTSTAQNWSAFKIAGLYLLIGGLWILFSDQLIAAITTDPATLTRLSLFKGWGYIVVTALLLYWLIRRHTAILQESEERYRTFMDNNPATAWMKDEQGRYIYLNKTYEERQGVRLADWRGKTAFEVWPLEIAEVFWKNDLAVLAGGQPSQVIEKAPNPDGGHSYWWNYKFPFQDASGKRYIGGIGIDITERRAMEAALRESEEKYRNLFETMTQGVVYHAPDGHIIAANPAATRILGLSLTQMQGRTSTDPRWRTIHEDGTDFPGQTHPAMIALQTGQEVRNVVMGVFNPVSDEYRWINVNAIPQFRPDETTPYQVYTTFEDITERKRAEEALRASEERLRQAIRASQIGIFDHDHRTDTIYWSPEQRKIHNWGADEPVTLPAFLDSVHPDDWETIAAAVRRAHDPAGDGLYDVEHRIIHRNGEVRWLVTRSQTFFEGEGDARRPVRTVGADLDITERKRAEITLRQSEQKFATTFRISPDSININRMSDGLYIDINEGFTALTGYMRQEVIGRSSLDLNLWADPLDRARLVQGLQERGEVVSLEAVFRLKDGTLRTGLMSARQIEIEGEMCILSITRDITERKLVEEQLLYQANLLQNVSDAIIASDPDFKITNWNQAAESLYGWCADEVIGRPVNEILCTEYADNTPEQVLRQFQEQGIWRGEVMQKHKDGTTLNILASVSMIKDNASKIVGVVAANRDITERKQVEEEIRRLNEELEQRVIERTAQLEAANKELEAFAYSVSHDLRAPLRAIDGYTRMLQEDYESALDANGQRICGVVREQARRMNQLIDDLLTFSRLSRVQLQTTLLDMQQLAALVFDELTVLENEERIEFRLNALPPALGDHTLIRQVWQNLFSNALKFSSKRERAVIEVRGWQEGHEIVYSVRDNGAGFEPEYAHRLFGVFQRLHNEAEFPGTGVGLAIVQRIIYRHGGRVWLEGQPDQGATVYFALPH